MAAFVRFVFTIMLVGMGVNLAVVLIANSHSQRVRVDQYQRDAALFKKLILGDQRSSGVDRHIRRADFIVESQRVDAHNNALESTLLLRQYRDVGTSQEHPLPVVRVVIPGDKLQAGGLHLEFSGDFGEGGEYKMLAGTDIVLFGLFCGADETAPTIPNVVDERFTFLPRDKVPQLLRLDPRQPQATYYELKFWQYLWSQLPEIPKDAKLPWVSRTYRPTDVGKKTPLLTATWVKTAVIAVRRNQTYTAYIDMSGVSLSEDEPGIIGLMDIMVNEGKKLNPLEEP